MVIREKKTLIILVSAITIVGICAGFKLTQISMAPSPATTTITTTVVPQTAVIPATMTPSVNIPVLTATPDQIPNQITAKEYLVGDITTGKVYIESNSSTTVPVASISKLVNALVATTFLSSTTRITITKEEADLPADGSGIAAGETYTVSELIYPLLLDSSNVAAEALASSSDLGKFLDFMSSYAWEIGMPDAFFGDPSGLSASDQASAKDVFTLAQYLYKYRPDILALTRTKQISVVTTTDHGSHIFASTHPFVSDPRFIGGKTGRTPEAGETMLTILDINGYPTAFIVLGSDIGAREKDTRLLIDKFFTLE